MSDFEKGNDLATCYLPLFTWYCNISINLMQR